MAFGVEAYMNHCSRSDLAARHHCCQRLGQLPVNRSLEFSCSIFLTHTLLQQELPAVWRYFNLEATLSQTGVDVLLQVAHVVVQDQFERFGVEWSISHDSINAVNKLRREPLSYSAETDGLNFVTQIDSGFGGGARLKANMRIDLL